MRRRSRAGGEPAKAQRRKTGARKRRIAPKAVGSRNSSAAREETKITRLKGERDVALQQQSTTAIENTRLLNELRQRTDDLAELLQQQIATADVLKTISRSSFDLQAVLDTLAELAARLCEADRANIWRPSGDAYKIQAGFALSPEHEEALRLHSIRPGRDSLLKENELIGSFALLRQEVEPFTDKQIALVQNFADQAVIAIENARLLNELRQRTTDLTERTADLTEALEQQTATSEVLRVISSSPGELEPVFSTMLENAVRICDAKFGNIYRWDGELFHLLAAFNTPSALVEARTRSPSRPARVMGRMVESKTAVHVADLAAHEDYTEGYRPASEAVELGGVRTLLFVPMLKENDLIGSFSLFRQEVRPFTDKQIELVQNFAAQAVIAIENTRLLNELRQALEQQTATSQVLQVISSSPGELEPVFASMLENAVHICDATFGNIYRWGGEALQLVAAHNTPPAFAEARRRSPDPPHPTSAVGRMIETKAVVHVADAKEQPGYAIDRDAASVAAVELGGVRTVLAVPMLKEKELMGAFTLSRQEVHPFTDKQIALVTNFAAQAVIAIENARLLNELRHRTKELGQSVGELHSEKYHKQ